MKTLRMSVRQPAALKGFLNVEHSWPVRALCAGPAATLTLMVTLQPVLAREMFRRIWRQDQFKVAVRRLSFYLRRGWTRLDLSRDPVYVFCEGMGWEELQALRRFLTRRGPRGEPGQYHADLAYVSASAAVEQAGRAGFAQDMAVFKADADALLADIRTRPFVATQRPKPPTKPDFSVAEAAAALADFSDCLQRAGMPWFVLSGTFLGIVREGGFLAHDYDIDVGVMADTVDTTRLIAILSADPRFHCADPEVQTRFDRDEAGRLQVFRDLVFLRVSHRHGVHIDVFVHYREGAVIWHASSLFRWDNSDFDLVAYELAGVPVLGPADADRYLTENYGTWRVPLVDFHSALDTTNQSVVRNPLSVAIFLRRVWLSIRENPVGAEALLQALRRAGCLRPNPVTRDEFDTGPFLD